MSENGAAEPIEFKLWRLFVRVGRDGMSVLYDFVRMRLYRKRASDFELLAETEPLPGARLRYRIIARHYRNLADREEQADKARLAERVERLRLQRQQRRHRQPQQLEATISSCL
jgi:hypothetical protein